MVDILTVCILVATASLYLLEDPALLWITQQCSSTCLVADSASSSAGSGDKEGQPVLKVDAESAE
jgi:hypothetical protein